MIDDKYLNLVIVYLKHIQFISSNTEVLPVLIIYDWQICILFILQSWLYSAW